MCLGVSFTMNKSQKIINCKQFPPTCHESKGCIMLRHVSSQVFPLLNSLRIGVGSRSRRIVEHRYAVTRILVFTPWVFAPVSRCVVVSVQTVNQSTHRVYQRIGVRAHVVYPCISIYQKCLAAPSPYNALHFRFFGAHIILLFLGILTHATWMASLETPHITRPGVKDTVRSVHKEPENLMFVPHKIMKNVWKCGSV